MPIKKAHWSLESEKKYFDGLLAGRWLKHHKLEPRERAENYIRNLKIRAKHQTFPLWRSYHYDNMFEYASSRLAGL